MSKIKLNRLLLSVVFFLGLVVVFSGCTSGDSENSSSSDPFNFYNKVQLSQSKSAVDADLGVTPVETDGGFIYTDEGTGFGVMLNYDINQQVTMKTLYNNDESEVMALSNATVTEDQMASITVGMTYEEVTQILGSEGTEIISTINPADKDNAIHTMIWFNDDETGFYLPFLGDKGTVLSVKFWK